MSYWLKKLTSLSLIARNMRSQDLQKCQFQSPTGIDKSVREKNSFNQIWQNFFFLSIYSPEPPWGLWKDRFLWKTSTLVHLRYSIIQIFTTNTQLTRSIVRVTFSCSSVYRWVTGVRPLHCKLPSGEGGGSGDRTDSAAAANSLHVQCLSYLCVPLKITISVLLSTN